MAEINPGRTSMRYLMILAVMASLGAAGCGETAYQEATNKAKTTPLPQLEKENGEARKKLEKAECELHSAEGKGEGRIC
jgi:hypothetical protein